MGFGHVHCSFYRAKYLITMQDRVTHLNALLYHSLQESHEDPPVVPFEWYKKAFPKIRRLTLLLKDLDFVDGNLIHVNDNSIVADEFLLRKMHRFKSLGRAFLGCPTVQETMENNMMASLDNAKYTPHVCFKRVTEGKPISLNCLSKVTNILNISAQQRKSVRLTTCPQVTHHQIWTGALEDILNGLKSKIGSTNDWCMTKGTKMGQQIVVTCLKFLEDAVSYDPLSTSWMRLAPTKAVESPSPRKWEEFLDMFNDLISCLKNENEFLVYVTRLEIMKEGLLQIKDVLIDTSIGYRETRRQQSLVQKKLTKALGHSSQCLFTLLVYYLYGSVTNIEAELCSWFSGDSETDKLYLCVGKILTSDEEKMLWNGVKQLDRALGLFKFIWEAAEMKGSLELQGHLWCVEAENRSITYKGNVFFLHKISL